METAGKTTDSAGKDLSENLYFVVGAYACMLWFGLWTGAYGLEFTSPSWQSVRYIRRRGRFHFLAAYVPTMYLTVYAYFQSRKANYHEMGATLLALAFGIFQSTITIYGLWQLHFFTQWTVASMKSMESLGFKTRLHQNSLSDKTEDSNDVRERQLDYQTRNESGTITCSRSSGEHTRDLGTTESDSELNEDHPDRSNGEESGQRVYADGYSEPTEEEKEGSDDQEKRIYSLAEEVLVNNSHVDVYARLYLRFLTPDEEKVVGRQIWFLKRLFYRFYFYVAAYLRFNDMSLSATLLEPSSSLSTGKVSPLVPADPELVWIRWATVLMAQTDWVQAFHGVLLPTGPNSEAAYVDQCNNFAEEILMGAALQSRAQFPFKGWHNYPLLREGKFSKQEFLKRACRTGIGLPYNAPHDKATVYQRGRSLYGYGRFEAELKEAVENLSPSFASRLSNVSIEELEWLAVFLSVDNWACGGGTEDGEDSWQLEVDTSEENDMRIENLRMQLGFSRQSGFSRRSLRFPLLRHTFGRKLWGNRNVLEVSCHIDNWLCLRAGDRVSYMMEGVPVKDREALLQSVSRAPADWNALAADVSDDASSVQKESSELEICSFLSQVAIRNSEDKHFEKSMTFLGCSMEKLRTSLAIWTEKNRQHDESMWKQSTGAEDGIQNLHSTNSFFEVEASNYLETCLRNIDCLSCFAERDVRMRILWELQNYFQKCLQGSVAAPNMVEAMILCVLSFPALSMNIKEASHSNRSSWIMASRSHSVIGLNSFQIERYEYFIRAPCGPQNISVCVSFTDCPRNIVMRTRLCMENGTAFRWQDWRDSFHGRLEGSRVCQEKLGLNTLPLMRTRENIWAGFEKLQNPISGAGPSMNIWKGWFPPRPSICIYEVSTSGFLMEYVTSSSIDITIPLGENKLETFKVRRDTWDQVAYIGASSMTLMHASLVAEELLKNIAEEEEDPVEGLPNSMAKAQKIAQNWENGHGGLAFRVLEVAAIQKGDAAALERAMNVLMGTGWTQDSITGAVRLLENFFYSWDSESDNTAISHGRLSRLCEDDARVSSVASLFERLLRQSNYEPFVCERYTLFMLILSHYGSAKQREAAYASAFKLASFRRTATDMSKATLEVCDLAKLISECCQLRN